MPSRPCSFLVTPLEGRGHVTTAYGDSTMRSFAMCFVMNFAVRNILCECVRAVQLGFLEKNREKRLEFRVGLYSKALTMKYLSLYNMHVDYTVHSQIKLSKRNKLRHE